MAKKANKVRCKKCGFIPGKKDAALIKGLCEICEDEKHYEVEAKIKLT